MIRIEGLTKTYNLGKANMCRALDQINMEVPTGQFLAVMGRSGSGKSTLLHILGCIDQFEKGEMYLGEQAISGLSDKKLSKMRGERIGIVLQDFALIMEYTVIENVMTPLFFTKKTAAKRKNMAMKALEAVGMADLAKKSVNQLSGGQKQRVAIARAIVNSPELLLADEPTGALDSQTAVEILDIFERMNASGITVVMITHDAAVAQRAQRIITLSDGRIVDDQNLVVV